MKLQAKIFTRKKVAPDSIIKQNHNIVTARDKPCRVYFESPIPVMQSKRCLKQK